MIRRVLLIGFAALICSPAAQAGDSLFSTGIGSFRLDVTSMRESKFKTVIPQQYDFSCGSAALATLLTFHYGRPHSEEQVFRAMWQVGDREAIQRNGFSLLDMQKFLAKIGLVADGFKVPLDAFAKVGIPAIALIDTKGYRHFVVVKGLRDGRLLVGDPAFGLKAMTTDEFQAQWDGIVFLLRDDLNLAKANFNLVEEWQLRPKSPLDTSFGRSSIGSAMMMMPGLNEF